MLRMASKISFIVNNSLKLKTASSLFVASQAWSMMNIRHLKLNQSSSSQFNFSTIK